VGVVLAVTLLAGVNISIDTTSNSMLLRSLDSVPYDYVVRTNNGSYEEIMDALTIEDVLWVEVISDIGYVTIGRWGNEEVTFASLSGVRPESEDYIVKMVDAGFSDFREFFEIPPIENFTGIFNIHKDGILLQEHQAKMLDVGVGDSVYIENVVYYWNGTGEQNTSYFYNITVSGIIGFQMADTYGSIDMGSFIPNAFVHIDDREDIIEELNLSYFGGPIIDGPIDGGFFGSNYTYYVWADRTKLVTLGDLGNIERNYVVMERSLKRALQDIGIEQTEFSIKKASIIPVIEEVNTELMIIRLVFLVILIPAIALGIYLSLIAVEIGMTRRMRELGILKTRGATGRQLFGLLLTESMILGIIAGMIGVIIGIIASQLFLSLIPVAPYFTQDLFGIYISSLSIILAMIFAVIMITVASYRPAKRITSQSGRVCHIHLHPDDLT
jgi:ABC-type lipoprotein release transport system permease subunit